MEAFESAGLWWLPEAPDTRIVGLVKYSDGEGFRLQIPFGFLGEMSHFVGRVNESEQAPIVHGLLRNGKTVTLVDAVMTNMNMSFPGAGSEEHKALRGFIGGVACTANPRVDRVRLSYSHLRDWVVWHPSDSAHPVKNDQLGGSVDYHYETPDDIELAAGDGWRMLLTHTAKLAFPSVRGFHLEHDCALTLEMKEPLGFDEMSTRFLSPIWLFLSFCLDRTINETDVKVRLAGEEQWLDVGKAQAVSPSSDEVIMEPFMLLPMPRLGDRASQVLTRWMDLEGDERRAISLLVGLTGERSVPSDLKFLAAAQALEAMSRADANEHELDGDEFRRRVGVILESVTDKKVRAWADRKLKHANQRPSADLLRDLASAVGEYVDTLAPDRERFFEDIRNNRNFYTHRDDSRVERVLEGAELYVLTQGILCFLKAAVLRKLDFSPEDTKSLMDDCQGTLQWRVRVAEQYRKPDPALA